ncbi:hypothetical protein [Celeribacter sp.]|uniref:hypothetical protein n=1 Tax=Celeribacter sp. TaxID=1890673 RepID=UPI003A8E035D
MMRTWADIGRLAAVTALTVVAGAGASHVEAETWEAGTVTLTLNEQHYALQAFQCLRDYPSPVDADRTVAFALDAAATGVPDDLLNPLRGVPEGSDDAMVALVPVLAHGPILTIARYADGMEVVVFYPTANPDEALFAMATNGGLDVSQEGVSGAISVNTLTGGPVGTLEIDAACP